MNNKVKHTIEEYEMIEKGDRVLAAFSGGADSTALFHYLYTQREIFGIELFAAHVNHGLRTASEKEEEDVKKLCEEWDIPLYVIHAKMNESEKPQGLSTETWAREIRYNFFDELAEKHNFTKIATAHTLNDQAETLLFRLARGTSIKGMQGIPAVRGKYIRPLIKLTREEIEEYCKANKLPYATDETNEQTEYARNKIRIEVLPVLKEVNASALYNLEHMAETASEAYSFIEEEANKFIASNQTQQGVKVKELQNLHPALRKEVIAQMLSIYFTPQKKHILISEKIIILGTGKAELAENIWFTAKGGYCIAERKADKEIPSFAYPLEEGIFNLSLEKTVTIQRISYEQYIKICNNDKKLLKNGADCDKILNTALLRQRREKDVFTHPTRNITKTVKKWMNEDKVPQQERETMPLICTGNTVLFYPPYGFCKSTHPTKETQCVLYITFS